MTSNVRAILLLIIFMKKAARTEKCMRTYTAYTIIFSQLLQLFLRQTNQISANIRFRVQNRLLP